MAQDSVSVDRWKYLGGSDIAAVMGISPFKTRWELLQEKAQLLDPAPPFTTKYIEYGNVMEPLIRNYVSYEYKMAFEEGKHYLTFGENGDMVRIHTDGENDENRTILEIKTTSQIHEKLEDYKTYLVQLLFYMFMTGYENGILAVYDRPDNFSVEFDSKRLHVYEIQLSDFEELVKDIKKAVIHFLNDLDKVRANPFLTQEDLLPADMEALASRLAEIKEQEEKFKAITEEKKLIEEKLAELMTENDTKTMDAFGWKMTMISGKAGEKKVVQEFDTESFRESHPRLWKKFIKETEKTVGGRKVQIKLTRLSNEN